MKRLLAILLLCVSVAWADPSPVRCFVNATIHPASGPEIKNGTIVVQGGRIVAVGHVATPSGATVEDLHGAHLYPSLIDCDTTLGLVEISEVRATIDTHETGGINPNARADLAFNPDSQLLPVAMSSGILVAGVAPRGGTISGSSAALKLSGWTREDMTVRAPAALYVVWPSMSIDRTEHGKKSVKEQEKAIHDAIRSLKEAFANARAYQQTQGSPHFHERDVKWEAMAPALKGEIPVVVQANRLDQIEAAVQWARDEKLKLVLLSGGDVWRVADRLAREKIPVIYNGIVEVNWGESGRDFEGYDVHYRAPARLAKSGVAVALSVGADAAGVRNLSDYAGRAAAYGMPPLEALQSITLIPARILGIADRLGSLDAGKDATFFVADGDILDTRTHVLRAWLDGREVDLQDRQKKLYEKYRNRPK